MYGERERERERCKKPSPYITSSRIYEYSNNILISTLSKTNFPVIALMHEY